MTKKELLEKLKNVREDAAICIMVDCITAHEETEYFAAKITELTSYNPFIFFIKVQG